MSFYSGLLARTMVTWSLMAIVVIGAGAAGLIAATRLRQGGHDVVVVEASERIGGRIDTIELAPGWLCDLGAHACMSDAERTLALGSGLGIGLIEPWPWATPDLLVQGQRLRSPFLAPRTAAQLGFRPDWYARLVEWSSKQAQSRVYTPMAGDRDARGAFESVVGDVGAKCIYPSVEFALGWPLEELAAAHVQALFRSGPGLRPLCFDGGMIAPFRRLAERLDVRTGVTVTRVVPGYVEPFGPADAIVVAVPAPIAAQLVPRGVPGRPDWIEDVPYSSEVSVLAYRRADVPMEWSDVVDTDVTDGVERVALIPPGVWWTPPGWQGAGITASRSLSARLAKEASDDEIVAVLFEQGRRLEPRLFSAAQAEVVAVARHRYAWPRWSPEHASRVARWEQSGPIVFAGDWTWHPFVEGAVRSGERAAAVINAMT